MNIKPKEIIAKIAVHTCIYDTVATFLILLLYFALNHDLSAGVQPLALVCILPFSLLFATANMLLRFGGKSLRGWRFLLHYALTIGGAFTCLYLPNKDPAATSAQGLILFLVFSLLYAIIITVIFAVRGRARRVKRDETTYHSVYKKK